MDTPHGRLGPSTFPGGPLTLTPRDAAERLFKPQTDIITAPQHYTQGGIEPRAYIAANKMNFFEGNVVKYTTRHRWKGKAQDIHKAIENLKNILRFEYGENP